MKIVVKEIMKKIFAFAGALSASLHLAVGQGQIDLITGRGPGNFVAPIFQPNGDLGTGGPFGGEQVGQPSTAVYSGAFPTGTTVYGGLPVTSAYDLVLLYSLNSSATSVLQMSVATIVPFRTAAVATAAPAGCILSPGSVPIPGTTGGTPISFAIGAFFVDPEVAGYIASNPSATPSQIYANAYFDYLDSDYNAQIGWGQIVPNIVLDGEDTAGVIHPPVSTEEGWTSFSLLDTPEPSTCLLSVLGTAVVLSTRRLSARLRPTQRSSTPDR